ncbi:hypothetical protein VTH82DRAFT_253 [Thermothelomyces myriococcoides]
MEQHYPQPGQQPQQHPQPQQNLPAFATKHAGGHIPEKELNEFKRGCALQARNIMLAHLASQQQQQQARAPA